MKNTILLILISLIIISCKHELEQPNWNVDMIIPLVHTKMSINNVLQDSNINVLENEEGFINLIYQESFIDINLDTLIKIDAIADEQTHTLDSTSFADVIIADTATIGETISEIPLEQQFSQMVVLTVYQHWPISPMEIQLILMQVNILKL